jgi:hypothetical protein
MMEERFFFQNPGEVRLTTRIHVQFALELGGRVGVEPDSDKQFVNEVCFACPGE